MTVFADRVKDTTTTTGTGTVTLSGTAPTGYQTFTAAGLNAQTVEYVIANAALTEWEVGAGVYTTSGTTLTRVTVLASSNAGALVNFSAGTKDVFLTCAARSISTQGKHAVPVVAGAMTPSLTGGCAALATIASAANQPDIQTLDFDTTTEEYAQFSVAMPKSWNEGTVTFRAHWSHAATTTNFGVAWKLQAVAVSDDDPIAVAYGTAVAVTDTGGTTNDLYITAESAAITVAGSPAAEDVVFFRVFREPSNGSDTMAIDARLHGITVYITTDAETDT